MRPAGPVLANVQSAPRLPDQQEVSLIVRSITDLKDRTVFVEELRRRRARRPDDDASESTGAATGRGFAATLRAQKLERAAPALEVRR
jgi:hypothetical protein